jgi:hypothetical protein
MFLFSGLYNESGSTPVDDWRDIVSVFPSQPEAFGLKNDGTIQGKEGFNDIVDFIDGVDHYVGLTRSGTVIAKGSNDVGQCNTDDWTDIFAIAADHQVTYGLKKDGTLVSAGDSPYDVSSVFFKDIVAIGVYNSRLLIISENGHFLEVTPNSDYMENEATLKTAPPDDEKGGEDIALEGNWVLVDCNIDYINQDSKAEFKPDGTVDFFYGSDYVYWTEGDTIIIGRQQEKDAGLDTGITAYLDGNKLKMVFDRNPDEIYTFINAAEIDQNPVPSGEWECIEKINIFR